MRATASIRFDYRPIDSHSENNQPNQAAIAMGPKAWCASLSRSCRSCITALSESLMTTKRAGSYPARFHVSSWSPTLKLKG